eukprot:TRINITY_DN2513_c0_g1_i2.p1 TRINITY_DN2513_c0_g1~~TRINITY_DN2513_c0_g1_i2.p1  ORF type:complete len:422 (-),score=87.97 TRINITY_DN2513_c0_g1_i2:85-1350(-)
MATKYDLTSTMSPFLDRHMVFPLLSFINGKKIYDETEILNAQLDVLNKTNMLDFALDIYGLKGTPAPEELKTRRESVVVKMNELKTAATPLLSIAENTQLVKDLQAEKNYNLDYLHKKHQVPLESLEALFTYAKFVYECGTYSKASESLAQFRALSTDPEKNFSALWGQYAADILRSNWDSALKIMNTLKEAIETKYSTNPLMLLQQRSWFIHWSLFVFFNYPNGRSLMISLLLQEEKYLNTIQTTCPHILRYLTAAVITTRRKKNVLKELVKVIQYEGYTYRDPITEFVEDLYVNFDFDGAQQKLKDCAQILVNDFFLHKYLDEFIESSRLFIFETYCRIHQCVDIAMLAEKLNMDQEAAERWIVNLIRNAQLDARIDSAANHVVMSTQHPSVYQQVIEKTKGLSFKSQVLANSLEKFKQ